MINLTDVSYKRPKNWLFHPEILPFFFQAVLSSVRARRESALVSRLLCNNHFMNNERF